MSDTSIKFWVEILEDGGGGIHPVTALPEIVPTMPNNQDWLEIPAEIWDWHGRPLASPHPMAALAQTRRWPQASRKLLFICKL